MSERINFHLCETSVHALSPAPGTLSGPWVHKNVCVCVCVWTPLQIHRYTQEDIERQRDAERETPLLCWTFYQWDSFCMDELGKLFWKNSHLLWGGPPLHFRNSLHLCSKQHMTAKHRSLFLLGEGDGKGRLGFSILFPPVLLWLWATCPPPLIIADL